MRRLIQSIAMKYVGSLAWQAYTYALVFLSKGGLAALVPYTYWSELGRSLSEPLVNNWFIKKSYVSPRTLGRGFVLMSAASLAYNVLLYFAFDRAFPWPLIVVTAFLAVIPAFMGWIGVHLGNRGAAVEASDDRLRDVLVVVAVSATGIVFARQFLFAVQAAHAGIPRDFALLERFYNPFVNVVTTAIILGSAVMPAGSRMARARDAAIVCVGLVFCVLGRTYWMFFAATTLKTLTTVDYIAILRSRRWHLLVTIPGACLVVFAAVLLLQPRAFGDILFADLVSGALYFALMRGAGWQLASRPSSATAAS